MHNLAANLGSEHVELEHGTSESEAAASISVELQVQFLNSAVDMMEPMVDRWPVTFELRSSGGATSMMLSSPQRLTVHVTPAAFRSVGDLLAFYQSFTEQARNADRLANAAPGSRTSACDASDGSVPMDQVQSSLYILRNRSGIRLSYWAHLGGNSHSLGHGEDSPLMVAPELHIVSLPESGQTIRARTICMQLEGAWTSLTSVIVDKVAIASELAPISTR